MDDFLFPNLPAIHNIHMYIYLHHIFIMLFTIQNKKVKQIKQSYIFSRHK